MSEEERQEFHARYDDSWKRKEHFHNRRVLEKYCQDDVAFLRQACRVFRREFLHIGNIEIIPDSITIASASNKILRKRFLELDTIGLIPNGAYTFNNNYRKKALM